VVAAAAVAAVAAVAACSAGTHPAAGRSPSPASTPPAQAIVPARVPGCSTATASAPELTRVPTAMESAPADPFGVVVTADGRWSFAALPDNASIGVFRIGRSDLPALVRQVYLYLTGQPLGEVLTHDGRYLLAADNEDGALVISVGRAEAGQADAQVGILGNGTAGSGAIEVAVSPDDRFAFVSLEDSASIAVYNLQRALTKGFGAADLVGVIPVGTAPVGLAVSPDGQWLYATSELARAAPASAQGTLTVISLRRAETDPAASLVATVAAGCSPVRVITSASGSVVWVTARGSDRVLGFSAARLRTDSAHSMIASVEVGEAPVGLALVDGGRRIVVADSNRFSASGASSILAAVDVAAALAGRPALLGYLPAGGFPREMALEPDGRTLLVSNFSSGQLEAVDVADLP
jgi:DNA-binding beta-propeller fold protein YncE